MTTVTTYPDYELNAMADFEAGRCSSASLHTANPTTVGNNEATGGSPAYARQQLTFASAGQQGPLGAAIQPATPGIAWSNEVVFDLPAGTYGWLGLWGFPDGGDGGSQELKSTQALTTSVVMATQGKTAFAFGVGPGVG